MWGLLSEGELFHTRETPGPVHGSPEIVGGDNSTCNVRPDISMYDHVLLWGPPMTPGSLAVCGLPADSLITPFVIGSTGANWNAVWVFNRL